MFLYIFSYDDDYRITTVFEMLRFMRSIARFIYLDASKYLEYETTEIEYCRELIILWMSLLKRDKQLVLHPESCVSITYKYVPGVYQKNVNK